MSKIHFSDQGFISKCTYTNNKNQNKSENTTKVCAHSSIDEFYLWKYWLCSSFPNEFIAVADFYLYTCIMAHNHITHTKLRSSCRTISFIRFCMSSRTHLKRIQITISNQNCKSGNIQLILSIGSNMKHQHGRTPNHQAVVNEANDDWQLAPSRKHAFS